MYITNIYKIVIRFDDANENVVDPRVYFDEQKARAYAKSIADEKFYDDRPIYDVVVMREVPDTELGWFRTAGMSRY